MQYDDYNDDCIVECEGSLRSIPTRIRVLIQALVAESWLGNVHIKNSSFNINRGTNNGHFRDSQKIVSPNQNHQKNCQENKCCVEVMQPQYSVTLPKSSHLSSAGEKRFLQKLPSRTEGSLTYWTDSGSLKQLPSSELPTENFDNTYQIRELASSEERVRPQLQLCNIRSHSSWQNPLWSQFSGPSHCSMQCGPREVSQSSKSSCCRTASLLSSNLVPFFCEKSPLSRDRSGVSSSSNIRCSSSISAKRYFSRTSKSWPCALSKLFISYFLLLSTAFISTAAMEIQRKSLAVQVISTSDNSANHGASNPSANQKSSSLWTNGIPSKNDPTLRERRSSGSLLDVVPPGAPNSGGGGRSSTECMLNKCNEWLHTASLFNRILVEQCVIFNNDLTCLIGIEKQCYLNLYYKGHRGWAEQKYEELNCTQVLREAGKKGPLPTIPQDPITSSNLCYLDEQEHHISLKSTPVFCSLFGDPHLYTYGGRQQTCATVGAWPLVDNAFFTIQALNVPMGGAAAAASKPPKPSASSESSSKMITTGPGFDPGGTAFSSSDSTVGTRIEADVISSQSASTFGSKSDTGSNGSAKKTEFYKGPETEQVSSTSPSAITRVMIIFRAQMNCVAKEKIYDTTEGFLPPSFNDGTSSGGHGEENLSVLQITNGSHVELTAAFLNTTIIIRRIGRYLSISVVSPVDVARSLPSYTHSNPNANQQDFHMELCSAGCPDVETLAEFPASPPRISEGLITYERAKKLCRHLSEFFFDSCVFDVMVTGDSNTFVEIGKRSKEDVYRLKSKRSTNQIDYLKYFPSGPKGGNRDGTAVSSVTSTRAHFSQYLMWLLIFLTFLFQLKFSYNST